MKLLCSRIDIPCLLLLLTGGCVATQSGGNLLVPLDELVGGGDARAYVAKWWIWANKLPKGLRPYQDPTGQLCGLNQSGDVWYLAGTDGTAKISRTCVMPEGKYLFFPIITMLAHSVPGKKFECSELQHQVAALNERNVSMRVMVDGVEVTRLELQRVRTESCFDAYAEAPYIENRGRYAPAASDGYWLMLKPLSLGEHTIVVEASYDNPSHELGDLQQEFQYRLQIVEAANSDDQEGPDGEVITVQRSHLGRSGMLSTE